MSTDIVHWKIAGNGNSRTEFQSNALKMYLTISLPIMAATFIVWYGLHHYDVRQERLRKDELERARTEV